MQDFYVEEKKVIIFVLCILMLGIGLSGLKKYMPQLANSIIYLEASDEVPLAQHEQTKLKTSEKQGIVCINQANPQELSQLSGIGPVIAQRIVDYRRQNGRFKSKAELMRVKGIGPKKFEKIKENISLE